MTAPAPVAVLIPTLRRPESLERALRSVLAQDGAALIAEVVVVDNAPEASARTTVAQMAAGASVPIRYLHERRPGVATARNAGLEQVNAPYVAFIDDDEEAPPGWLATLHTAHLGLGADVTFGPIRGRAEAAPQRHRAYLDRFFSRLGPETTGLTEVAHGCGNSMMTRATALAGVEPFEVACDQTGGEDDRLFCRVREAGGRFGWAADAWLWEHAPPERSTLAYALTRGFGYGQSPSQIAWRARRLHAVAGWMAVGAVQAAGFGAAAGAAALMGRASFPDFADRAARGLGKLVWFRAPRFYGAAAAARRPRPLRAAGAAGTPAVRAAPG